MFTSRKLIELMMVHYRKQYYADTWKKVSKTIKLGSQKWNVQE